MTPEPGGRRTARVLVPLLVFAALLAALYVFEAGPRRRGSAPASGAAGSAPRDTVWAPLAVAVRGQLAHAWEGYARYAAGHDELRPLSRTARDWYQGGSLLMTPVDGFDAMLLLGLKDDAAQAKAMILDSLSFDRNERVQVFEVTIRLLGGLLSAYQMDGDPRFLALAKDLGRRLLPAFGSPTGMPYRFVNLRTGAVSGPVSNPAEVGTLMLEFGTLSKLTGDTIYYHDAKRAVTALFDRRSSIGLVGSAIDVRTGEWKSTDSHVSGGIDSYYEYLLKAWLLFGDRDFLRMWRTSVSAVDRYLPDHGPTGLWYGHVDMRTGKRGATHFGALEAFFPGTLTLGSEAMRARASAASRSGTGTAHGDSAAGFSAAEADTLLGRAVPLMASVDTMWERWGIEPEVMDYRSMKIVYPGYELRPEALESAFYLWRATHDVRYREMGRRMFRAIVEDCRTDAGFAALKDVRTGERVDRMPSYFLAETLKYAWLLFSPDSALSLRTWGADVDGAAAGSDSSAAGTRATARDTLAVVFNTEAHPLRRTWH